MQNGSLRKGDISQKYRKIARMHLFRGSDTRTRRLHDRFRVVVRPTYCASAPLLQRDHVSVSLDRLIASAA